MGHETGEGAGVVMSSVGPAILGLVSGAIGFLFFAAVAWQAKSHQKSVLLHQLELYSRERTPSLPVASQPSPWDNFLETAAEMLIGDSQREKMHERLAKSGKHNLSDIQNLARQKVLFALAGLVLGLLMVLSGSPMALLALVGFVASGFYLPDVLVYNQALKRSEEIEFALADSVDLLTMCVESGLGLEAAFARVAETQEGPMAEEFAALLAELRMGKSRNDAFDDMAARCTQPDLLRFISAMKQVDKLGIPVSAVLQEQSREMRATRRERAREQAQKVPVKILMPVMLCFLPGIFLIILGPAVLSILGSAMFGS